MKLKKKAYFYNLDSLRFFASLLIVIHHIEQFKLWSGLPNVYSEYFIKEIGRLGVSIFFVLSGFVTTRSFLLLKNEGNVITWQFITSRLKKLLPLYYLIVILSLLILPRINNIVGVSFGYTNITPLHYLFYILFLPDLLFIIGKPIVGISQSWFIGIQEHLYLIWFLVIKNTEEMKFKYIIIIIFLKFLVANTLLYISLISNNQLASKIMLGLRYVDFESILIGSFGAYYILNNKNYRVKTTTFLISFLYIFFVTSTDFSNFIKNEAFNMNLIIFFSIIKSLLILQIIIYISVNNNIFPFNINIFRFFGKYSYGIYMFHSLICVILINYLKTQSDFIIYGLTISLSILISIIYFKKIETKLLKQTFN